MEKRYNKGMMEPKFNSTRLENDLARAKSGDKIFVGSSGDMFGEWVLYWQIEGVLNKIKERPDLTFQFLTKNPKRYSEFKFPQNCWLGATIDTQDRELKTDLRIECDNIIFVSFEPLLGEIYFHGWPYINWVIMGADSNPGAKKPKVEWFTSLMASARAYKVPVWMKDNVPNPDWKKIKEFPTESGRVKAVGGMYDV
jgi:protein gp37